MPFATEQKKFGFKKEASRGVGESAPSKFLAVGPESELKALRSAITETVMVEGAKATVTRAVSIGVMNSTLRLKESRMARVTVEVIRKK